MKIKEIEKKIRQARNNARRQRLKEELDLPTRVSSSFWERAERDWKFLLKDKRARHVYIP